MYRAETWTWTKKNVQQLVSESGGDEGPTMY